MAWLPSVVTIVAESLILALLQLSGRDALDRKKPECGLEGRANGEDDGPDSGEETYLA